MAKGVGKGKTNNPNGRPKGVPNKFSSRLERETRLVALENLVNSFTNGCSYVYYHTNDLNEVFYIGKGKNNRAWEKNKLSRNDLWYNYVMKNSYTVSVIASNLSDEEALVIESALIKLHNPKTNISHAV